MHTCGSDIKDTCRFGLAVVFGTAGTPLILQQIWSSRSHKSSIRVLERYEVACACVLTNATHRCPRAITHGQMTSQCWLSLRAAVCNALKRSIFVNEALPNGRDRPNSTPSLINFVTYSSALCRNAPTKRPSSNTRGYLQEWTILPINQFRGRFLSHRSALSLL